MNLSITELKQLILKLEAVRRKSTVGNGHYCNEPILDDSGDNFKLEPKPRAREYILKKHGFETLMVDNVLHAKIPLGCHGRSFLTINVETKEIECSACKEKNNGT